MAASWLPNWPDWPNTPIPGVSLSAGGLLALADLSTIAQRTAITGGSSWLDSLLLAPGLHYQQAVEELGSRGSTSTTGGVGSSNDEDDHVEECDHTGTPIRRFRIRNTATKMYIRRIARPAETVTLDVGAALPAKRMSMGARYQMPKSYSGIHVADWAVDSAAAENGQEKYDKKADDCHGGHTGSASHFLYLASPVLTIIALACVVLVKDWWAFGQLGGLMLSRILNIWIIKQRTKRQDDDQQQPSGSFEQLSLTTYNIPLPANHPGEAPTSVQLRGRPSDLRAITSSSWLRTKTHGQGYLEATAKLVVYAVAAFSGNATQIGAIIMMGLLLSTAGLLALSNSHAKCLTVDDREGPRVIEGEEGGDDPI
ncbi:hypothetical protein QBC37DRAFT_436943 [Rhypophila decipiens]|uniref:Uncharacterized protein n=1 Tax=Rhypophila decipiens TaxID=261697 RepID=A0AAN6YGS2_9PEZI|nr:hypothetical protein QBC37DRAFT_436943 [Rhypophila decipiens]